MEIMTTVEDFLPKGHIRDYIPDWLKNSLFVAFTLLALFVFVARFREALKTAVAQRLPDTAKYNRLHDPGMYWVLVVFYAAGSLLMATCCILAVLQLFRE